MKALGSHPIKCREMVGAGERGNSRGPFTSPLHDFRGESERLFLHTKIKLEKQVSYVLKVMISPSGLLTGCELRQEPPWKLLALSWFPGTPVT